MQWIAFLLLAVVAAFSGTVALNSHGPNEHWYGTMIFIFSALASIMVPVLLTSKQPRLPSAA